MPGEEVVTISFMTAYWATIAITGILGFVVVGICATGFFESDSGRVRRNCGIVGGTYLVLWLIALLLGVWLPAFIPGLY